MKRYLPLLLVISLAACAQEPPAEATANGTVAATAAPDTAAAAPAPAATDAAPADAPVADAPAEAPAPGPEAPVPPPAPVMPDPANAPREGIDYVVLAEPVPTLGQGGIEVAEVFAYTCIHCANLQPSIDQWKPKLASDVRFVYVPGAFGGVSDNFARGFYAAESMGILEKTHNSLFQAHFIEHKFQTGSVEEIADHYASQGADRATFLSTMQSFAVTGKINRARQFAQRANVQSTPTLIVNGKYSALMTGDRGPQGLLDTIDWLVARERAQAAP